MCQIVIGKKKYMLVTVVRVWNNTCITMSSQVFFF